MATIALPREETPGHHMIGHSGAEEGWAPAALSRQNGDSYMQNQARISSRGSSSLPAGKSASHTEPGSTTTKGPQTNDSWWDPARRPSILTAASLPHNTAAAVRAIERQGELSSQPPTVLGMADAGAVWPEEPAPEYGNRISGENNIAASSGTNRDLCLQPPTFHADGRLEAVPKRIIGSFETTSGGDTTWRTGGGETSSISGGATGGCWSQQGGIDAEVSTTGLSWSRESGGKDDQRQPESLNTPSQRLSEMKTFFGRQEQVSTPSENEGNQRLSFTSSSGNGGAYRSRLEVAVDNGDFRGEGESHGQINGSGNANGGDNRQADRTPWHGGCSAYPPPAASASAASTNSANDTSTVGIVDHPSRDGIENGGRRSWNEGAGAAWPVSSITTATASGDDRGEGGVGVDFDPHTESRNTQSAHVIAGDSSASWWKDAPEPVLPSSRWSLQLPNLAPPLAQRHGPSGIRGLLESSATAGVTKHALPLKLTMDPPVLSDLGKSTSQHHRHRNAEPLYNNFSNFDVMDSGGVRYGARTENGVSSMHGGQKWGTNPPQLTGDAYWGLGVNGVSSNGGGSGRYFNSRIDETRRGDTQLFDSVHPSGRHPSFNNGTFHPVDSSGRRPSFNKVNFHPVNPSGRHPSFNNSTFHPVDSSGRHPSFNSGVQASIHPGDAESLSRQDINPKSGTVRGREIDGMGVPLDRRDIKKTRVARHEDLRMYTDWTGGLNGEESLELRRGFGSEGGATVEAGMSERSQKGKKIPASSRRCRAEGCKSHPNFGVEGDRRALYCAKHKLPGMVNVKAPRCQHPSCTRNPVYGNAGDPRATYCLSHKSPLMVDVKNRRCQYPSCKHQPSFGVAGDRRANFCFTHKLPSHVNIRRARAKAGETYNTDSNGN